MKRHLHLLLLFLLPAGFCYAQQDFEVTFYAVDALGNRDSVVIGKAPGATVGLDAALGEVDLSQVGHGALSLRSIQRDSLDYLCLTAFFNNPIYFPANLDLKRDMRPVQYGQYGTSKNSFQLLVKAQHYPVTVYCDCAQMGGVLSSASTLSAIDTACTESMTIGFNSLVPDTITLPDSSFHSLHLQFFDMIGRPEQTSAVAMTAAPNPAADLLQLSFTAPQQGQVELLDALGRLVLTQEVRQESRVQLPVAGVPFGLYLVRFTGSAGTASAQARVVKQ